MVWWSVELQHWRYPNRFDNQLLGLTKVYRDTFVVEPVACMYCTSVSLRTRDKYLVIK
jgi:hypothetical protein